MALDWQPTPSDRCRGTSREVAFAVFERYDLEDHDASERPRYADLAAEFSLPVTQVTNHLHWARQELRKTVLEKLREIEQSGFIKALAKG
jgi:hypothetical protein